MEANSSDVFVSVILQQNVDPLLFGQEHSIQMTNIMQALKRKPQLFRSWLRYLLPGKFTIIPDQNSVAFMLGNSRHNKIKNVKIKQWRIELSEYFCDIIYCQGKFKVVSDALLL